MLPHIEYFQAKSICILQLGKEISWTLESNLTDILKCTVLFLSSKIFYQTILLGWSQDNLITQKFVLSTYHFAK